MRIRYYISLLFVFIIFSCNNENNSGFKYEKKHSNGIEYITRYYDGKKESTYSLKNGVQHGLQTTYYPNGKIYRTHNFIDGKQEGWMYSYDTCHNIIEEFYYIDNNEYIMIKTEKNKCNYIYIKPFIISYKSTIYKTLGDSIPIQFFIPNNLVSFEKYVVKRSTLIGDKEGNPIVTVYPFKKQNFIYLDESHYERDTKYIVSVEPINPCYNKTCLCDSVDINPTEKIISIY